MVRLRIKGLIQFMNRVNAQLAEDDISPVQLNQLQQSVEKILQQVKSICEKYQVTPEQLPAPTLRAFRFLSSIDWLSSKKSKSNVAIVRRPKPSGQQVTSKSKRALKKSPRTRKSISLLNTCSQIQERIEALALSINDGQSLIISSQFPDFTSLLLQVQNLVQQVERSLKKQNLTPDQIPPRTLRAYRWLKSLSEPEALISHIQTVKAGLRIIKANNPGLLLSPTYHFSLSHTPYLFRSTKKRGEIWISVHEGFRGAPVEIIEALIHSAIKKSRKNLKIIREYGRADAFISIRAELEVRHNPMGMHHNLEEVFSRVNNRYFNGKINMPSLIWNSRLTRQTLGHYDTGLDLVMISKTLDQVHTPPVILDFVMYHELLHKHLGVKHNGGRNFAHTTRFRAAERKFEDFDNVKIQIQKFLSK